MVFLGYIIPEKNQKELLTDSKIAAQNEQQDIINNAVSNALKKKQLELLTSQSAQVSATPTTPTVQPVQSISEEDIVKDVINSLNLIENEPVVDIAEIIEEKASPIDIAISNKIAELGRDLTAKEEIAVENDDENIIEIPAKKELKRSDSAESAITDFSEAPTVATTVLSTIDDVNLNKLQKLYDAVGDKDFDKDLQDAVKDVLIKSIENSKEPFVYGAMTSRQKNPSEKSLLSVLRNKDGSKDLVFAKMAKDKSGNFKKLKPENYKASILVNMNSNLLKMKNSEQDLTGMGLNNTKTFIDLSNDMLVVKQSAKSKSKVINRPLSPLLKRVVQNLQKTGELDVELYDLLKEPEQDAVNKIITLSKLQTPDRVRENQKDRVFNLRNRYEILLGELQAGNDGSLVKNELSEVVQSLYDIGEIKLGKKNAILSVLNS